MEKKLYEILAEATLDAVKLFEDEVQEITALNAVLEENEISAEDLLESVLSGEESEEVVEEACKKKVKKKKAQMVESEEGASEEQEKIEESEDKFEEALDTLLSELASEE